jgi:hypothetical protein
VGFDHFLTEYDPLGRRRDKEKVLSVSEDAFSVRVLFIRYDLEEARLGIAERPGQVGGLLDSPRGIH